MENQLLTLLVYSPILMSDILCIYQNALTNEEGYLFVERSVNLRQLVNFIEENLNIQDVEISNNGKPITNNKELVALYDGDQFSITISSKQLPEEPVIEEKPAEVPQPEPVEKEEKKGYKFGESTRTILERFGIDVNNCDDPKELINELPFPFQMIVRQQIKNVKSNPENLELAARQIAGLFNVSADGLVQDAKEFLDYLNSDAEVPKEEPKEEPKEPIHCHGFLPVNLSDILQARHDFFQNLQNVHNELVREQPKQEVKEEQVKQVIHHAVCDKCDSTIVGIRYKCLHCPDYDLCESCESINGQETFHDESHVFAKHYKQVNSPFKHPIFRMMRNEGCRRFEGNHGKHERKFKRIEALEEAVKQLQQQVADLSN